MKSKIISLLTIFFFIFSFKLQANNNNWKPAQEGNKIIMIRHALAPGIGDPKGFKIEDCSTQRNLNEAGINQSKNIGKLFKEKKIKIDLVLSSQWCRCKDTAKYAFKNYKEFSALNSTFSPPYDKKEKQQIEELRNFVRYPNGTWKARGGFHDDRVMAMLYALFILEKEITERFFEIVKSVGYPEIKLEKKINFKELFEKNQK